MKIKFPILLRANVSYLLTVFFAMIICCKILVIQWGEQGDVYRKKGRERTTRQQKILPKRGSIYSYDGKVLVRSLSFFRLAIDSSVIQEEVFAKGVDSLSVKLHAITKEHSAVWFKKVIKKARRHKKQYVRLTHSHLTYKQKREIRNCANLIGGGMSRSLIFEKTEKRVKPYKRLASRTIGYVNDNRLGAGLEFSFDKYLRGKAGKTSVVRIPGGGWLPVRGGGDFSETVDGCDITSTLDIGLQDISNNALLQELKKHNASYGGVVLMEVSTGEIKAIANFTKKNINGKTRYVEDYNYMIGQAIEPGSTMKLASVMAILEKTDADLDDMVNTGNGRHKFYDKTMVDYKRGGFGRITFKKCFEYSSNIGISTQLVKAFGHQPQVFVNFLKKLRFDETIDVGLEGAGVPYIKLTTEKNWSGVTLPWMSIGYELRITPLHTLMFYNAVANNGKLVEPKLVKSISRAGRVIQRFDTKVLDEKICSSSTLSAVQEMLDGVVERGTARNIKDPYIKIAGKTGTAQTLSKKGKTYEKKYYTSFAGYFPSKNPKYSCVVMIYNPQGSHQHGSDVAAPVFKKIADKINSQDVDIQDFEIVKETSQNHVLPVIRGGKRQDLKAVLKILHLPYEERSAQEWVRTTVRGNTVLLVNRNNSKSQVPDVVGLTLRDALYLMESRHLNVRYSGLGRVASQSRQPGTSIKKNTDIKLVLN